MRCQEVLFMITEKVPALKFALLHIICHMPISDFWAKGQRVYCSTNQFLLYGYMCTHIILIANTQSVFVQGYIEHEQKQFLFLLIFHGVTDISQRLNMTYER